MPAARILVVGSLHHDVIVHAPRLPALDETLVGRSVDYAFGGKGGNQAVAASRHGASVAFAGRVGNDEAGRFLLSGLDAAHVDRTMVVRDAQLPSGMSVAIVTDCGEYGAVIVSAANQTIGIADIAMPDGVALVMLQNEIPEPVNIAVARLARACGARVMLNAAPARAMATDLLDLTDIVLVNRIEAAILTGASPQDEPADMAEALGGGRDIIVTLGAQGCIVCCKAKAPVHVAAFPVTPVSAHGAGDCFAGALAARLVEARTLNESAAYASAAAALHVAAKPAARQFIGRNETLALLGA